MWSESSRLNIRTEFQKVVKIISIRKTNLDMHLILLTGIILIGSFLRFYHIGVESLWGDEVASLFFTSTDLNGIWNARATDLHPPFYYISLYFWIKLFGTTETAVRSLSAIFGIAGIAAMYFLGSKLFNRNVGLLGAFIVSINMFHIRYSQETRMYSLLVFLTLVSMYFFVCLLNEKRNRKNTAGYVLSGIILIYTHVYGMFIIILQNLYFFLYLKKFKRLWKIWLMVQGLIAISFLPWMGKFLNQVSNVQEGTWIPKPDIESLEKTIKFFSGSDELYLLFAFFALLGVISIFQSRGNKKYRASNTILIILLFVFPIIIPFLISQVTTPMYWYKYVIPASIGFYLLMAVGIDGLKNNRQKILAIIFIVLLSYQPLDNYYGQPQKPQWHEAAQFVKTNIGDEDIIFINSWFYRKPFSYYYSGDIDYRNSVVRVIEKLERLDRLDGPISNDRSIWIVYRDGGSKIKINDIENYMKKKSGNYRVIHKKEFYRVRVYHYGVIRTDHLKGPSTEGTVDEILVDSGEWKEFELAMNNTAGTYRIGIEFINDLYDKKREIDRNLYVKEVVIGQNVSVKPKDMKGSARFGDVAAFYGNEEAYFTVVMRANASFKVVAKGKYGDGWPIMRISIDPIRD